MLLSSSQRAKLRGLANTMPVVLYIGKDGINDATIKEVYDLLNAKELIKCAVQRNAPLSAKEACEIICEKQGAVPVQVIGSKFIIYRRNEKEPKIEI
ncbi:MAG: YhbY family RNA-binding protein [Christensenellales bacterium]|jgi:RNA-binding protein|nr:YhbY family RNA-binding protein [Christensenellaceae bacterium]